MGQIIACMINRAELLEQAVRSEQDVLGTPQAGRGHDGWGVGFYQAGEVLHKKHPQGGDETLEWANLLHGVRSDVAIAHVREATVGARRADNNHPFRMRQWLFAHAGLVHGFSAISANLLESLPDFLRRNIRGETDSEHLFHVFLSFLHDAGQLDAIDVSDQAVLSALRSAITLIDRLVSEIGAPQSDLNLVLTNGRAHYALRRGATMVFVERDRLSMPEDERKPNPEHPSEPVRYVLVGNGTPDVPVGYRELPDAHLLVVNRDVEATLYAL
jgi:predicted glutamine amidotransferase